MISSFFFLDSFLDKIIVNSDIDRNVPAFRNNLLYNSRRRIIHNSLCFLYYLLAEW